MIIRIILVIVFLILSAFFSGAEIVFSKVNQMRLLRDNSRRSLIALDVAKNYSSTLSTILIGNNLVNIALSSVASLIAAGLSISCQESTLTLITSLIVTVIVLIFGEILPKTISQNYCYSISRLIAPIIKFLGFIFYPIIFVTNYIVEGISRLFYREKEETEEEDILDDELKNMAVDLKNNGVIDNDDEELINSAIDFIDITAWEIMVPRVDVIAYNFDDGFDNIIKDPKFFEKSRVPIYNGTIDEIIGIVSTTEVLKRVMNHESVNFENVSYEPLYVHKTMPIIDVLTKLKKDHKHLAIVLDEWGGVMGIITMEDILEELFGDIWDEIDHVEPEYQEICSTDYIVDADMNIHDLFDLIEYDDRDFESEYATVGGWCTEVLNKFPEINDEFTFENYFVKILSVDGTRVEKVEIIINEIEENDE